MMSHDQLVTRITIKSIGLTGSRQASHPDLNYHTRGNCEEVARLKLISAYYQHAAKSAEDKFRDDHRPMERT